MDFETDVELVAALVRRRPEAWESFLESYRTMIYGVIRRRTAAGREDYDEIYADVLAKICADEFKLLRRWNGSGRLKAFLAICVSNFVRDLNRAAAGYPEEISIEDSSPDLSSGESLEAEEDGRRAIKCYRECVAKLTEKQRAVLELHATGYSYREISKELKIKEGYVGVRLTEIRAKLRELLLERCPDSVEMVMKSIKRRSSARTES